MDGDEGQGEQSYQEGRMNVCITCDHGNSIILCRCFAWDATFILPQVRGEKECVFSYQRENGLATGKL